MDFQSFVDQVGIKCCVMSVEKTADGGCGQIRVVCGNQQYRETVGSKYYDNMPYEELVPRDNVYETLVFRAAFGQEKMHAYMDTTEFLNCWTEQTIIPLESDREDIGYCQCLFEYTADLEADRMAAVSVDTASAIIRSCIKLAETDNFRENVGSVLEDIMEASDAIASRIMLVDHEKQEPVIFCERIRKNIWPERDPDHDVITYDLIKTWDQMIGATNAVVITSEADFDLLEPQNPEWIKSMRENRVESLVLIPLRRNKKILGYLFIMNFNVDKVVEIKELLELLSFFLASELSNYLFFQKLEVLSNFDDLTGLRNRHAMMTRVQQIDNAKVRRSYGVINLDLNGLKVINDKEGHVAGDFALMKTADFLRSEFREDDLYRIGGDEFIILITGIGQSVFDRRVQSLVEKADAEFDISFSLGSCWSAGDIGTHEAFMVADRNMYDNKRDFYDRHPEMKHY